MLKTFKYTKENGDTSTRTVYQMNIVDGDKLLCVDLTEFDELERQYYMDVLDYVHKGYIQAIKDEGLSSCFRTFLINRMK